MKELARSYLTITKDLTRVMNRLKALYRSWGIPCAGTEVYAPRYRAEWLANTGLTSAIDTSSRNRASQEPDGHRWEMVPKDGQTLSQRRSSCLLWFQIVGVETYLLLPHDQGDRGNLPRQSQARHRRLPSLGEQIVIEIAQWSGRSASSHRCTLENIFEIVVVVLI